MKIPSSILYLILRPGVTLAARLFFRKIEVRGKENIPGKEPVIMIANHQNAMMDPVMCCVSVPRQLHWLTRADIFKSPAANKIFRSLNMLPVYRERDKVGDIAGKNDKVFEMCCGLLSDHKVVAMFPEGVHRGKKQLHLPLKKGLARLAFRALDSNQDMKDLYIVPVGLDYGNFFQYRSDLLIIYGEPLNVREFYSIYKTDKARALVALMDKASELLSAAMIDIKDNAHYDTLMHLRPLCDTLSRSESLHKRFIFFKQTIHSVESADSSREELLHEANLFKHRCNTLKLDGSIDGESVTTKKLILRAIVFIAGIPIGLIAVLSYGIIYAATEYVVKTKIKDHLFQNSIRLVFWLFLAPIWTILLMIILRFAGLSAEVVMITFMAVVISGILSLSWWQSTKLLSKMLLLKRLETAGQKNYKEWKELRKSLIKRINGLNRNKRNV